MELTCVELDLSHDKWYIGTDWHLWIKDRKSSINGLHPVYCRENCEDILKQYESIDKFIFLGDLVDDEFYKQFTPLEQEAIFDEMFTNIKNKEKYLILGNNDPEDYFELYEKYGFKVVDALFVNDNYLLTHYPINLTDVLNVTMNIHGHYHGHGYYWTAPYQCHLDIWNVNRTPVLFKPFELLRIHREYRKDIKDIYHLHLKNKEEFIKYRGTNKTEDEI